MRAADPGNTVEILSAMTGDLLGRVPRCTADDVRAAAQRARKVQRTWASRPVEERAAVLLCFHELVLQRQDDMLDLI